MKYINEIIKEEEIEIAENDILKELMEMDLKEKKKKKNKEKNWNENNKIEEMMEAKKPEEEAIIKDD